MREFFTKDIGWKIFSLVLAVILYLTVSQATGSAGRPLEARAVHTYRGVPVLVMSSAANVSEFKVNPAVVQVTLRGRPETLTQLQEEDIRVIVDLTGIESSQSLTRPVHVSIPAGITLVEVVPAEVDVVLPLKKEESL